ncbi:NAD-dependent epimerase/dehydratase [Amycolatopsis magusensis]|uniref:dTDP-4-keto-6-deoxyhexose 4-ketoreductase n=1 Tax=Amycolatopsis magusensis TaxID=882444 RepID=A0ABS4PZH4_9PSEU|nr:NAD-dependent epimerase/dehydratase [Amycolatopsis magusensis]MBP2184253.1 dTDP-4-keto-6-deoxyhexose 4-ketoreductase [Amycolatopsis magusensis]MDI5980602.1 NAD-dependent epimerase/dehydratase [Amycolatopsis magusensis]
MTNAARRPLVVVLGASGLLGTAVLRELAARPVRLRAVSRRPASVPGDCPAEHEIHLADLTAPGALAAAVAGADAVIHLVAHLPGARTWRAADQGGVAERVNVGLVLDLIEVLRRRRPARPPVVLFAGSTSQVGTGGSGCLDGTERDVPQTAYDRQKVAAELALESATAEGVLLGATLRLSTLYSQGAGRVALDRGVVASMMRRALAGEPLTLWFGGAAKRDLLCVDDAARAFADALDHGNSLAGRHWLIGTGAGTGIAELFALIAEVAAEHTGKPPVEIASVAAPEGAVATDVVDFFGDPAPFRAVTGWRARTPLRSALENLAAALARDPDERIAAGG